jgi:arsenite methyltransferase
MPEKMIRVYDPPMCCSTGVCGPTVDPELVRFARDVAWFKHHGIEVERFNLAQEPGAFVENPTILALLNAEDTSCLPVVIVDDRVVSKNAYPSREELAALVGAPEGA